ncbi:MAG: hypothetical protein LBK91_06200 [Synergistaceae bacterium]|jgi:hypothetical protein|nr:hypothetical protein [Synergistaceae bacterium]
MKKVSLSNIDAFKISDNDTDEVFYGCCQDWFGTGWQRLSGCGPSVACNIFIYHARGASAGGRARNKHSCAAMMEEVWKYVTPTKRGIHTAEMLRERVLAYGAAKGMTISSAICEVPKERSLRPSSAEVTSFLEDALSKDIPVAFLNLCNGQEKNLDEWHWVTVAAIETGDPKGRVPLCILDRGRMVKIDLALWLDTTSHGGGFVHFSIT